DERLWRAEAHAPRTALAAFTTAVPAREWTVGELARFVAIGGRGPVVVGSGATVADEMERWVDEAGVDGFNLAYVVTPGTFADFVDHVVPELRRRGRVRDGVAGATLRENLGTAPGPPGSGRRGARPAARPAPRAASRRRPAARARAPRPPPPPGHGPPPARRPRPCAWRPVCPASLGTPW